MAQLLYAQALYGTANALYWKSFERQNSTHLTLLKHQNIKTAQYKLPKNHWVIPLFEIFRPVGNKLLVTVSLEHAVTLRESILDLLFISGHFGHFEAIFGKGARNSQLLQTCHVTTQIDSKIPVEMMSEFT